MYTLWVAEDPQGGYYAGAYYATPRNCSNDFAALTAYAREAAITHRRTIHVRREDFTTAADFEEARDACIQACDDAYIADCERQADAQYAATHDEPCYLLVHMT